MAHSNRLIVGLGNPGEAYKGTRHNVGFEVIDRIAHQCTAALKSDPQTNSFSAKGTWKGYSFTMAKPQTWMNCSGESAQSFQKKMHLEGQQLLVVYDDINLPVGALRLRSGGSAGGHNGMQNIIDALSSDNIPRLRVGIGQEFERGNQSDYVLSGFEHQESELIDDALNRAKDAALMFITHGIEITMNRFNRRIRPSKTNSDIIQSETTPR